MGILSFIVTLFGGILAGIVLTILVVYLINELMDTPKWLIGLMGLFLLFFLSFQFTAIIGAGKVKGVVEDITGLSNTVSGKLLGSVRVLAEHQLQSGDCVIHAACRVDAGRDSVADILGGDGLARKADFL